MRLDDQTVAETLGRPPTLAELLDDVRAFYADYIVVGDAELDEITLWSASTHVFDIWPLTAYQLITSATPETGKSTLLDLMSLVTHKPLRADNISAPALYRAVDKWRATVLIDEADSSVGSSRKDRDRADAIRGVLNGGFSRRGQVVRCKPNTFEPGEVLDLLAEGDGRSQAVPR